MAHFFAISLRVVLKFYLNFAQILPRLECFKAGFYKG